MADKHSYANHSAVHTSSLHFEVSVDFDKQKIAGFVDIRYKYFSNVIHEFLHWVFPLILCNRFRVDEPTSTIILDTKKLIIHKVEEVSAAHTTVF